MTDMDYSRLDPGIRDVVRRLREAGFQTTDSGDGSKGPGMECALPIPNVTARLDIDRYDIFSEAHRMAELLGEGWRVEASYSTADRLCFLVGLKGEFPA